MLKQRHAGKVGLVATNQILLEACVFARNIIIARLIGAETLGEFIFIVLAIRLFAMSTDLAEERYIIQAKEENLRAALASSHLIMQVRAVLLAMILLAMGMNGVKDISFVCYALLAGSALLRGFTHQGYRLKQRQFDFRPALYVEGLTSVLGVLSIFVLVSVEPYLEVICACLLAQAALHTAMSHATADKRFGYEADFHAEEMKKLIGFGLPLLLTGAAMFWSMQGERLILSVIMDAADFARFSMLFQLALVPILILSRMSLALGLPAMAEVKEKPIAFQKALDRFHQIIYGVGFAAAAVFFLGANPVLTTLFGADFEADFSLVVLLAIAQTLRLCRCPQSVAAQALGQTDIPLKANLVRIIFVFFAVLSVIAGGSLTTLLILACIGEGAAWATQGLLFSLRNRPRKPMAQAAMQFKEVAQ